MKTFRYISILKAALISVLLIGCWFAAYSQTSNDDDVRGMKAKEFAKNLHNRIQASRPKSTRPKSTKLKSTKPKPAKSILYTAATPDDALVAHGANIGITFWRLRQSKAGDDPTVIEKRKIVRKKGQTTETELLKMTPARAQSEVQFADGDLLRIAVEIPFEGCIYIFNREQYGDGTLSEPYMIFPSKIDIGKTDKSIAGKLLFLPNEADYFEVKRSEGAGPEKTAELLILMVAPQPLSDLSPLREDEESRKIDLRQFEYWQQQWGGRTLKFNKEGGAGAAMTKVEKYAGEMGGALTGDDDQFPQTIYHVEHKPGSPLLFDIPIRVRR